MKKEGDFGLPNWSTSCRLRRDLHYRVRKEGTVGWRRGTPDFNTVGNSNVIVVPVGWVCEC